MAPGRLNDVLTDTIRAEFGITQPAVSRHLRVLRDSGWATSTPLAQARVYSLVPDHLAELDAWLARYRRLWSARLDALDTEIHRGRKERS